jgi:uncharacterized damage-inducible protein DinB
VATRAGTELGSEAVRLFEEYLHKIEAAVDMLAAEQVWWRANQRSNSIGNLVLHLVGNLSQWVLAGLGGEAYQRRRTAEFAAREGAAPEDLLAALRAVVQRCVATAGRLDEVEMTETYEIQGYQRDGFGVLLHAVEHMAYHTGQIVLLAKQLAPEGAELEFYPQLKGS